MQLQDLTEGQKVHYHPIIDEKHDGKIYTVRCTGSIGAGQAVVWLNEKSGCVCIEAISAVEE